SFIHYSSSPLTFLFYCYRHHRHLHSFPTRRSSDLPTLRVRAERVLFFLLLVWVGVSLRHAWNLDNADVIEVEPIVIVPLADIWRSEEHTSELQSRSDLVCRLLLEKKKRKKWHVLHG